MPLAQARLGRSVLGAEMVSGILLILLLIGSAVLRYPSVFAEGGVPSVLVPVVILLLYGAAALRARLQPEGAAREALRLGAIFGLIAGGLFVVHLPVEHFVHMPRRVDAATTLGVMGAAFSLFAAAGLVAAGRTGSFRLGVLASVWSAMVSMVMTCLLGFALLFLIMPRLERNYQVEFARRGGHDPEAFAVVNTLESATSHLVQAPILALVFGSVGASIGRGWARRRTPSSPA